MEKFIEVVTNIRNLRNSVMINPKEEVDVRIFTDDENLARYFYQSRGYFKELAKIKAGKIKDKSIERPAKSIMRAMTHTEVFIPLEGVIDISTYIVKLGNDLKKAEKEFEKVDKKLNNPKFIQNAPDEVVEEVKEKANGFQEQVKAIQNSLEALQ